MGRGGIDRWARFFLVNGVRSNQKQNAVPGNLGGSCINLWSAFSTTCVVCRCSSVDHKYGDEPPSLLLKRLGEWVLELFPTLNYFL